MSYNEFVLLFNLNVYNFSVYILKASSRLTHLTSCGAFIGCSPRYVKTWMLQKEKSRLHLWDSCYALFLWKKKKVSHPWAESCQGLLMPQWMEYFHVNDCNICALIYIIQNRFNFRKEILFRSHLVLVLVSTPAYSAYWAHFTSLEGGSVKKFNCQVLKEVTIKDRLWMRLTSSLQFFSQRFD